MLHPIQSTAHKKALIVAFYLSKFDRKGVRNLGYNNFTEAFNKIGEMLGVKPSSVKHMRDSFDPYCSYVRVGWYQRKILPSRMSVIEAFNQISEEAMIKIIQELLYAGEEATKIYTAPVSQPETVDLDIVDDNPFALRIQTGEKAEQFFMDQYPYLKLFQHSSLEDTRKLGIGFDFRVNFSGNYYAVEVKGVKDKHGYISFTDKEWNVAKILKQDYVLALVRGLDYNPEMELIPDPTQIIAATMKSVQSVSIIWNAKV
jgi:hypothetical protein